MSKKKKVVHKIEPHDQVTDLRKVVKVGDRLVVREDNGRCVVFEIDQVMKEVVHGLVVVGGEKRQNHHWSTGIDAWRTRECLSVDDPAAERFLVEVREQEKRDMLRAGMREWVRDRSISHRRRYPRNSRALASLSGVVETTMAMGPYNTPVSTKFATATVKVEALKDVVHDADCLDEAKRIIEEQDFMLARVREDMGPDRFEALVKEAIKILEEEP